MERRQFVSDVIVGQGCLCLCLANINSRDVGEAKLERERALIESSLEYCNVLQYFGNKINFLF